MMIHSVYFWLKDEKKDECGRFEEALRALVKIPEIQLGHFGKPAPTAERPVTDHSFDYSLILTFASKEAHDAYQVHPDHDVFVDGCKDLWAKVVVYDSELL